MIDFGVDIQIDSPAAEAGIRRVVAELDRMERASKAAAEAVKRGLADGSIKAEQEEQALKKITHEFAAAERAAEQAHRATTGFAGALNRIAGTNLGGIANQLGTIGETVANLGLAGQAIGGWAETIGGAVSKLYELNTGMLFANDHLIEMRNRLRMVTNGQQELTRAWEMTLRIANQNRADVDMTRDMFARVARTTNDLGFGLQRTASFVDTLQKMFAASGRSGGEAAAAMLQFSQALGSGRLQGDEFRSISENMPQLLDAFAARLHVTKGALKELSSQGKITTDVMIGGIEDMAAKADVAFAQMEKTFASRMQPTLNAMKEDPFLAQKAFSNPADALKLFGGENQKEFMQIGGFKEAFESAGFDFAEQTVSDANRELGVFAEKMKEIARLTGYEAKPAIGDLYENIQLMVDAASKFPPAMSAADQALAKLRAQAGATDNAWSDLLSTFLKTGDVADTLTKATGQIRAVTGAAESLAQKIMIKLLPQAYDPWAKGNEKIKQGLGGVHHATKQVHDAWSATYVSPTLAALDAMIDRVKRLTAAEMEAAKTAGLIQLGQPGSGLRGGAAAITGPSAEADALMTRVNEAKAERDRAAAYASAQNAAAFRQQLYAGNLYNASGERQGYGQGGGAPTSMFHAQNQEQAVAYTKRWTEELEKNRKKWEDVDKFGGQALGHIEDSIVKLVETGKFSFKSLVESILADLTRLATHRLLMSIIGAASGGSSPVGAIASGSPEALAGGSHAYGGSWTAPRTGGAPDSIPVLFNVSPGEHVQFTPQGQQQAANVNSRVSVHVDPRQLMDVLDGPAGREIVHRHVMKLPKSAFR